MSKFFLSVLNMSIAASWIVLAVFLLRLLLKRAPKWISVLLWAIVAIRLVCPFTIRSDVSLIPSAQTISPSIMTDTVPQIYTGIPSVNNMVNPVIRESSTPDAEEDENPLQLWIRVAAVVWGIGSLFMLTYGSISYLRVKKKVCTAVLLRDRIYQSEYVASPFVLGIIRPKIYLPFYINNSEMIHVIAHEEAHIRRRDHWWKPLSFAILSLHWFNPLVWIAYVLLCRDIEMACDQKVVKTLTTEQRADYSQTLLNCSVSRRTIVSCPLAFGEVGVKDRVKSVLSYKKPAFWILVVGIAASIVFAVCFLTNPTYSELGSLENVALISDYSSCVWISDGFSYEPVGPISEDLLEELAGLKTSKKEISLNRSEDRDKTHTIVLQTESQAAPSPNSYLEGLYIHFNSDFTAVWINDNAKPTLTYKVIEPNNAKKVYQSIVQSKQVDPVLIFDPELVDSIAPLRKKFPMYFDLDASNGLEVYIWQLAETSYSCALLPARTPAYTADELFPLHKNPASMDEMQAIVAHYILKQNVSSEDIAICPISMPHSSFAYVIDETYREKLSELFWSKFQASSIEDGTIIKTPPIDEAFFDIDGDGTEEHCILYYGPTSGLFTFTFSAFEGDTLEYFNIFNGPWSTLYFGSNEEGQAILISQSADRQSYLNIAIEDGNIVLISDEQDISYWGEQGPASPFAPIVLTKSGDPVPIRTIEGNFRTYLQMSDGTYQYNGYTYKYRLVITGRMPNAVADTTYVYLSNIKEISFERAMWASGLSSSLEAYFSPEEAVLVEIETAQAETGS